MSVFEPTCACRHAGRWRGILSVTGFAFALPAALLLRRGECLVGALVLLIAITSVAYHTGHHPLLRAVDVAAVGAAITLAMARGAQLLLSPIGEREKRWLLLSMACATASVAIPFVPWCNVPFACRRYKGLAQIKLPFHVALHALGVAAFISLAEGVR